MDKKKCTDCGKEVNSGDFIMASNENGMWVPLCFECYSHNIADRYGIELQEFEPVHISMFDIMEDKHEFKIERRLYQTGVSLIAKELGTNDDEGYYFQVLDEFDSNLEQLMKRLLGKMKKMLCNRYITTDDNGMNSISGNKVIGRVLYDVNSEEKLPLCIVDGKGYTWEELGRLVMTFEGFQFKLQMVDTSDDVD